ncbi:MAG: PDZ domain-containing protein, partial [Bacteroidota bacterium]
MPRSRAKIAACAAPRRAATTSKTLHSRIADVDYYFHFQGKFGDDKETEDAFQSNLGKIIREQTAIFGEMPLSEYHFIYQLLPYNMGHAVEHKYSSCYAMPDRVATSARAIGRLNSISSHEFFHLWNVKRIRPAVMWPYDYQNESHTTQHWFTEGVTDYYASLSLTRCGLYTREIFYKVMGRTIQALENNYASQAISPAQSSFDSWLERSKYGLPYHRISYYTLGTRVGLIMDLEIRRQSKGKLSLDDLFRKMFASHFQQDKGVGEDDIQQSLEDMTGNDWGEFFRKYVHGTEKYDYAEYFKPFGLAFSMTPMNGRTWDRVGISRSEETDGGLFVEEVLPNSDAARAGLGEGDVITRFNGKTLEEFDAAMFFEEFKREKEIFMKVKRNGEMTAFNLVWTGNDGPKVVKLEQKAKMKKKEEEMLDGWLDSKPNWRIDDLMISYSTPGGGV